MESLRLDHTEPYVPFRWVHTEKSRNLGRPIWIRPCILGQKIRKYCLAKCYARISTNISANLAIYIQVQAITSVRVHSVKAYVMTHHTATLQN